MSSQNNFQSSEEARSVLDAFFLGRAAAQSLSERLADFLADVVADINKAQAEQQLITQEIQNRIQAEGFGVVVQEAQQRVDNFNDRFSTVFAGLKEEVQDRARMDLLKSQGINDEQVTITAANDSTSQIDVQEVVDELRAEIASTRAEIQLYKNAQKLKEDLKK